MRVVLHGSAQGRVAKSASMVPYFPVLVRRGALLGRFDGMETVFESFTTLRDALLSCYIQACGISYFRSSSLSVLGHTVLFCPQFTSGHEALCPHYVPLTGNVTQFLLRSLYQLHSDGERPQIHGKCLQQITYFPSGVECVVTILFHSFLTFPP